MSRIPDILAEGRARIAGVVGLAGIGQGAATGLAAFATRDIFAALHQAGSAAPASLAMLGGAGIAVALFRVLERTAAERLGQRFAMALRRALYRHLAHMPAAKLARWRAGALALRFVGDLSAARNWVGLGLTRVLSSDFIVPGAALALWLLNPALAPMALIPIVLSLVLMAVFSLGMEPLHRRLRSKRAGITIAMLERVPIAPVLDLMGRTNKELRHLDAEGTVLTDHSTSRMGLRMALRATPEIGALLAAIAILWTALRTEAPAADAAGMLAVIGILTMPLRELADVWDRRCAWAIAREKLAAVLARPTAPRRRQLRNGPPVVHFAQVRFRGLELHFSVAPGDTVLVEGAVGAGKSSLLGLVAGLERPEAGTIDFGGGARRPVTVHIGANSPILQGSLRRALTLGVAARAPDAQIEATARQFGLGPTIARLGGLSGRVGEGGRTLSDREKLRVHLARAALSAPDLLVIDLAAMGSDTDITRIVGALVGGNSATTFIAVTDCARCNGRAWGRASARGRRLPLQAFRV